MAGEIHEEQSAAPLNSDTENVIEISETTSNTDTAIIKTTLPDEINSLLPPNQGKLKIEPPVQSGSYGDHPVGDRLFVCFFGQNKGLWQGCGRTVGPNEGII